MYLNPIQAQTGQPEEALRTIEQAMRLDPGNRDIHMLGVGVAYSSDVAL
jgi:hypothetical protein